MKKMRKTRTIKIGDTYIGGGSSVKIQSMTNTYTADKEKTIEQIKELEDAGCDIIRVAVPDEKCASAIREIKKNTKVPLVADIHINYKLAVESIENGADKVRINPGNIGSDENVKKVVDCAKYHDVPIRIGVNSGSVEKEMLLKYGSTPRALVESTLKYVDMLEKLNFYNIVLSLKSSNVVNTIKSYEMISEKTDYPLHIGVTESGTMNSGLIKSSAGLGILLWEGIGDTLRISLTADPVYEVVAAHKLLRSLGMEKGGIEIISCPTCGRCKINLIDIAQKVENKLNNVNKDIKIAIMGCEVNGPGEAKDADIGVAGGNGCAVLFEHGKIIKKIEEDNILDELMHAIEKL